MKAIDFKSTDNHEVDKYLQSRADNCLVALQKSHATYSKTDEYVDKLIHHFSIQNIADLRAYEQRLITKEEFLMRVRNEINRYDLTKDEKDEVFEGYQKFMWSYDVIDALINNRSISDIKLIDPFRVIVKQEGKRKTSDVMFRSEDHYQKFISRIAVRNHINLSSKNAVQHFVDVSSNELFRLRFNITTELINANSLPSLHIRKIPKFKYSLSDLLEVGLATKEQFAYLLKAIELGKSILFCGKGASGKTTLMNFLLDYFPHDSSILCIQDNDELFSEYHPDILCQSTLDNKDSEVRYELKDLAKNGLLLDIDWYIIGEIKGEEARYLFDAACTGAHCMTSLHSSSGEGALVRLADLAKRASDYSQKDILRILSAHFHIVVYMDNFKVTDLLEIKGWNNEQEAVIYEKI